MEDSENRLNDLKAGIDYVEPKYLPNGIPDHFERLEFWKACERLNIPKEKWPIFDGRNMILPGPAEPLEGPRVPRKNLGIVMTSFVLELPPFELFEDDHRSWKIKAHRAWGELNKKFGPYLRKCTTMQRSMGSSRGRVRLGGQKRAAFPLGTRYEMAALRYCLGYSWQALEKRYTSTYRKDQIRKMVATVLLSLDLPPGNNTAALLSPLSQSLPP